MDGTAYVLFGVLHNDQKYSLPSSLQKVPVRRFTILLLTYKLPPATPPPYWFKVGFYVTVDHQWSWGGHTEERAAHTGFPQCLAPCGKLHICPCPCAYRKWWEGSIEKTNTPITKMLLFCVNKKASASTPQAAKWWRLNWRISQLSHQRIPSTSRTRPNILNLEWSLMSR